MKSKRRDMPDWRYWLNWTSLHLILICLIWMLLAHTYPILAELLLALVIFHYVLLMSKVIRLQKHRDEYSINKEYFRNPIKFLLKR